MGNAKEGQGKSGLTFEKRWLHAIMDSDDAQINASTIAIACALVRRMPWKAGGEFSVSQGMLAEWAHCTRDTVRSHLSLLCRLGFLSLGERTHARASQTYIPSIPVDDSLVDEQVVDDSLVNDSVYIPVDDSVGNALTTHSSTIHTFLQTEDQTVEEEGREIDAVEEVIEDPPPRGKLVVEEEVDDVPLTEVVAKRIAQVFARNGHAVEWMQCTFAASKQLEREGFDWEGFTESKISEMSVGGCNARAILRALSSAKDITDHHLKTVVSATQSRKKFDREAWNAVPDTDDEDLPWLR